MIVLWVIVLSLSIYGIMWSVYKVGYSDGKHRERMHLIDIMKDIPTIVTTQEHVLYVVNYIVNKMREE
jgi:hypothetical protein